MKTNKLLLSALVFVLAAVSCKKNDKTPDTPPTVTTGFYVLSEGLYGGNNTTLTYYDFKTNTPTTDFFENVNGSKLGDTGNDLIIYGGKSYIVMNGSSYVEVADAFTAKNIAKIDFKNTSGVARQPRYAVGYKNKVLVSSYDGTVAVIDTTSLTAEKFITVGSTPEQLVVSGDKLFVANSGGLNYPNYDSTLSVVDLTTFTETTKITVGLNPGKMATDNAGNIFVVCTGDYGSVLPKLVSVNAGTNAVQKSAQLNVNTVRCDGKQLYVFNSYGSGVNVALVSIADLSITQANFITDGTTVTTPYGLNIDETTGDVYVTDAKDYVSSGEVFCFDKTGKKKFSFSVTPGINPNKVVLIKQ